MSEVRAGYTFKRSLISCALKMAESLFDRWRSRVVVELWSDIVKWQVGMEGWMYYHIIDVVLFKASDVIYIK